MRLVAEATLDDDDDGAPDLALGQIPSQAQEVYARVVCWIVRHEDSDIFSKMWLVVGLLWNSAVFDAELRLTDEERYAVLCADNVNTDWIMCS